MASNPNRFLEKGALTSLRVHQHASLLAVVACLSLTLFSLDGLMSGHFHVEEGSLSHHRHLFDGAHEHEGGVESALHAGEEDHDDEGGDPDGDAPGRSQGLTFSTLEMTTALAASGATSSDASALPLVAMMAEPEMGHFVGRFSLTEGARPPPGS